MKITVFIVLTVVILSAATFAYAGDSNVCTWAESKSWAVSAPGKLTRGVINVAFGWTNLFIQPFKDDSVIGGVGLGLSNFFVRTFQGAGEILLFWLPPASDEPLHECAFYDMGLMPHSK